MIGMLKIKTNKKITVSEILSDAGYYRNWDKCGSFWTKNNQEYEFVGWGPSIDEIMPKTPEYIEMEEVS